MKRTPINRSRGVPSESLSGPACDAPISAPSVVSSGLRIERQALAVLRQAPVERAEGHPGLGDHGHVFGFVGDDTVHAGERDAEHRGRAANFAERARGAERRERDWAGITLATVFALPHQRGDFVAVARLDDYPRGQGFAPLLPADAVGAQQPADSVRDLVDLDVDHRL
jgi:hypothetical protein